MGIWWSTHTVVLKYTSQWQILSLLLVSHCPKTSDIRASDWSYLFNPFPIFNCIIYEYLNICWLEIGQTNSSKPGLIFLLLWNTKGDILNNVLVTFFCDHYEWTRASKSFKKDAKNHTIALCEEQNKFWACLHLVTVIRF